MSPWRFLALRYVVLWVLEDACCFRGLISITVLRACHNANCSWVLLGASQHLPYMDHWSEPSFHCFRMPTYPFGLGREAKYTEAKTVNSVRRKCWIKSPVFSFVFTVHEWQGHAHCRVLWIPTLGMNSMHVLLGIKGADSLEPALPVCTVTNNSNHCQL